MEVYLVGGAVRDKLLGRDSKDLDYVVVGSSREEMISLGYKQVGADFPVFLHPETQDEYALARIEKKSGTGYAGFETDTENVSLEDDLKRRDLTINAIAMDSDGNIVDPFGGVADLENHVLRHVSEAFAEDPLRVLRVARFAARYAHRGFTVAPETNKLMQSLVKQGEISNLTKERVWIETEKALSEKNPELFFRQLEKVGATKVLMPELTDEAMLALEVNKGNHDVETRFAILAMHLGVGQVKNFTQRLRVPREFKDIALAASRVLANFGTFKTPEEILKIFQETDAFRKTKIFLKSLEAVFPESNSLAKNTLVHMLEACLAVSGDEIVAQGFTGKEVGEQMKLKRLAVIKQLQAS
jgi:tRNA nucleotidyltransferase (CCA-adding enzyme)